MLLLLLPERLFGNALQEPKVLLICRLSLQGTEKVVVRGALCFPLSTSLHQRKGSLSDLSPLLSMHPHLLESPCLLVDLLSYHIEGEVGGQKSGILVASKNLHEVSAVSTFPVSLLRKGTPWNA